MNDNTRTVSEAGRFAVVLGTGGRAGWAWHLGVGRALHRAGLPLAAADLVIGTSAGAAIGALLTAGEKPDAILDRLNRRPSARRRRAALDEAQHRIQWSAALPSSPRLVIEAMRRRVGPMTGFVGAIPAGWFPTALMSEHLNLDSISAWPPNLRIVAVSLEDGSVSVFGPDRPDIRVGDAVEASSAVPLMFRPKVINGIRFVDGGLASPTHARLALQVEAPHVIVSAPAVRGLRSLRMRGARRAVNAELHALEAEGRHVTLIAPRADLAGVWQRVARRDLTAVRELMDRADDAATAAVAPRSGEA